MIYIVTIATAYPDYDDLSEVRIKTNVFNTMDEVIEYKRNCAISYIHDIGLYDHVRGDDYKSSDEEMNNMIEELMAGAYDSFIYTPVHMLNRPFDVQILQRDLSYRCNCTVMIT
ncbi:hypothetical protein OAV62_02070 [bacterium]|nr:hypothetical protein [bacterium]